MTDQVHSTSPAIRSVLAVEGSRCVVKCSARSKNERRQNVFNDDQRKLLNDLLDEYVSRIEAIADSPDRLTDWVSDEVARARSVRSLLNPPPPDPELERLLNEEEQIGGYALFSREVQAITGEPCKIGFDAWRKSPLGATKRQDR